MDVACRHDRCTYHRTANSIEHAAQKLLRNVKHAHPESYNEGEAIVKIS